MDNLENNILDENSFIKNTEINGYLLETSKWGKLLAIVGFVLLGLMILVAIFIMFGLSKMGGIYGNSGFPMGALGFVYIIIAGVYYFPVNYLYQFSVQIKRGLKSDDLPTISSGFQSLKSLFKFMGIFTIVILSIYGVLLLIAVPTMMLFKR